MQLPPKLVRVLVATALLAGGAVLFAAYQVTQLVADVDIRGLETPSRFDAKEARRKIKLLSDSKEGGAKGFIRLAEVEINSLLHEKLAGDSEEGSSAHTAQTAAGASGKALLYRARVDLTESNVLLYCWVKKPLYGKTFDLVWTRSARMDRNGARWSLRLDSMRVGTVKVPPKYWADAARFFAGTDEPLAQDWNWLLSLPALDLRPAEVTQRPELRLYNFAETNLVWHSSP